jgi:YegS/Rv2252/BmrU family lipid kinase
LRICCIINARSGTESTQFTKTVEAEFARHNVDAEIIEIEDGSALPRLAKLAVEEDYDTIVAVGGDGTINAVASAVVGKPGVKFGVIPRGTLNHFAGALGIPPDLERAVSTIVAGHAKAVDVGQVNGQIFVNNSSLGFYPSVVKMREGLQKKGASKWPAAFWSSVKIFFHFHRMNLHLVAANGLMTTQKTPMLFVGNNAYDTSIPKLGTRSSLEGGKIWIMMPTSATRIGLLSSLVKVTFGRETAKDAITLETTEITITSNRGLEKVAVDGEVIRLQSPFKYKILPKSLRVIVPASEST